MARTNEEIEAEIRETQARNPDHRVGHLLTALDEERRHHAATKVSLDKSVQELATMRGLRVNEPHHEAPMPVIRRT